MNKNILYISYDGLTDTLGQSQILPYIIGLSKKFYRFTILSAEKRDKYEQNKGLISKICADNNIDWQPVFYTKNPPIISSILDIRKMIRKAFSLHTKKGFFAIHSRSYMGSLVALKLKQKFNVKFIFDMRGFYPDERVDGGTWNLNKWYYKQVYNYFKRKEKRFLFSADAIVSLTYAGKEILENTWKVNNNINVIPCATDTNLFKPLNIEKKQSLTIGYLGSLGTWYMLPEMLSLFKAIQKQYPKSRFIILTPDNSEQVYVEAERQNIPKESIDVRFAKRQELPSVLSTFDIGVFFIKPSFSKQASSPVKQGELMSMGIPVITNSGVGDTDDIINKYKSGILIKSFTQDEYEIAVNKISEMLEWDKAKIREGALEYFSLARGIKEYAKIYENL